MSGPSEALRETGRRLLDQIAADAAARWRDEADDPSDALYDERGLPR